MCKQSESNVMKLQDLKAVTAIQFFDQSFERPISESETESVQAYGANIIIDNKYIVQWSNNELVSIPSANEIAWEDEKDQEVIYNAGLDLRDLEAWLYEQGLKDDYHFLSKHPLTENF